MDPFRIYISRMRQIHVCKAKCQIWWFEVEYHGLPHIYVLVLTRWNYQYFKFCQICSLHKINCRHHKLDECSKNIHLSNDNGSFPYWFHGIAPFSTFCLHIDRQYKFLYYFISFSFIYQFIWSYFNTSKSKTSTLVSNHEISLPVLVWTCDMFVLVLSLLGSTWCLSLSFSWVWLDQNSSQ